MDNDHNIGFQSECIISQLESELEEKEEFIILRTPSKPMYYFGNLLALKVPLSQHTKADWLAIFDQAFAATKGIQHYTFSWSRQLSEEPVSEFIDAGFEYEEIHVLTQQKADFIAPTQLNNDFLYRPLLSDSDWQQWVELSVSERQGNHAQDSYREFLSGQSANYRALAAQGLGEYYGAFSNNRLIGFAGLYYQASLARFQHVLVAPEFQNRGVAKALITNLIGRAPQTVSTLVILADEHYHASRLYQSLGFQVTERQCSLCWWPAEHRHTN